jgi:hypothetical protein
MSSSLHIHVSQLEYGGIPEAPNLFFTEAELNTHVSSILSEQTHATIPPLFPRLSDESEADHVAAFIHAQDNWMDNPDPDFGFRNGYWNPDDNTLRIWTFTFTQTITSTPEAE